MTQSNLDFGAALSELKCGNCVQRAGWNGKKMFLVLVAAIDYEVNAGSNAAYAGLFAKQLPWIGMKTADNGFVPWLASQTDILASDWAVVDPREA